MSRDGADLEEEILKKAYGDLERAFHNYITLFMVHHKPEMQKPTGRAFLIKEIDRVNHQVILTWTPPKL